MVSESATLIAPGAAGRLDAERLRLVCRAVVRTPLGVLPASAFIAYVMAPHVGAAHAWGWMLLVSTLWSARAVICARLLRRPPPLERVPSWIRFQALAAAASGIAAGSAGALFHAAPELEAAILTMVVCGWCAAGLGVSGALPIAFYGLIGFFIPPIALGWALSGYAYGSLIAILLVLFMFLLGTHARDSAQLVGQALRVGFENEALAGQLRAREAEAQAARSRAEAANLSKSAFLAAASHDLRQPLHALSLFSGALMVRAPDGVVGEIGRNIDAAALSLSALVDSLLDISKLDAGAVRPQIERVSVRRVLERIEAEFASVAEARKLELGVRALDIDVETDPVLLERILRNLAQNALKYTSRGRVVVSVERQGDAVRFAVSDTGPGIAPEERERIFEEFYQIGNPERDRAQGLGLGLAIVRRLARLLGTEVVLESEPGKGATFSFAMPRASAGEPAQALAREPRAERVLQDIHVLVVDDEPSVRVAMRTLLEAWGCRVTAAAGRDEAEQLLEKHDLRCDVLIADFRLRQHENGIDTVRRLRERLGREVPALLISGDTAPERLREAESSGLPLLHKPVAAERLRGAVLQALNR